MEGTEENLRAPNQIQETVPNSFIIGHSSPLSWCLEEVSRSDPRREKGREGGADGDFQEQPAHSLPVPLLPWTSLQPKEVELGLNRVWGQRIPDCLWPNWNIHQPCSFLPPCCSLYLEDDSPLFIWQIPTQLPNASPKIIFSKEVFPDALPMARLGLAFFPH